MSYGIGYDQVARQAAATIESTSPYRCQGIRKDQRTIETAAAKESIVANLNYGIRNGQGTSQTAAARESKVTNRSDGVGDVQGACQIRAAIKGRVTNARQLLKVLQLFKRGNFRVSLEQLAQTIYKGRLDITQLSILIDVIIGHADGFDVWVSESDIPI